MPDYCSSCMAPLAQPGQPCPVCGAQGAGEVPAHHLCPGTVLNRRYYVGKALGEGGFGITYIGRDLKLDMKVAVKEYYPSGFVNRSNTISPKVNNSTTEERRAFFEKGRERFLREARTLAKFSGEPGIVDVRDFFEENNTAYIVMEYLDGVDLKRYLRDHGTLTPEETIRLLTPVMYALRKIHAQGLIHRDISPDNIMLVGDQVKLLDFGAARSVSAEANKSLSVMLKPGYAPEEQYRSKGKQGPWTDIYALCATMYKCITGVTPDDATQRIFSDEVKNPSELGVRIAPEIEQAVMRGMSVRQQDRYQSMDDLIRGLQGIRVAVPDTEGETVAGVPVDEDRGGPRFAGSEDDRATVMGEELPEEPVRQKEEPAPKEPPAAEKGPKQETPKQPEKPKQTETPKQPEKSKQTEKPKEPKQPEPPKPTPPDSRSARPAPKKRSKLPALLTAVLVVIVAAILIFKPGSGGKNKIDPEKSGFLFRNEDSIDWIEPENRLDTETIYQNLNYTPEMFYGTYALTPDSDADAALEEFKQNQSYGDVTASDGRYLTNLPYAFKAKAGDDGTAQIELYYLTEDGKLRLVDGEYIVEDGVLGVSTSDLQGGDVGYAFAFDGIYLTLSDGKESVTLEAEGFSKSSVVRTDRDYYGVYATCELTPGSPQIDNIKGFGMAFSKDGNHFCVSLNDGTSNWDGIGRMTPDGLFVFSYSDGHTQNTKYYTHQYAFFYSNYGLILTDGETTYYYLGGELTGGAAE